MDENDYSGTLPGVQKKYLADRTDCGRYVVNDNVNLDLIPSRPAPPIDPAKLAAFKYEPGPPSIVDVVLARARQEV